MISVLVPAVRGPEHRYIVDVLIGEFLGISYTLLEHDQAHIEIRMADGDPRAIRVRNGFLTMPDADWLGAPSLPTLPLEVLRLATVPFQVELDWDQLPIVYGTKLGEHWIQKHAGGIEIGIDLFGAAFFFLTRYEEVLASDRDTHDRFPAAESIAMRGGFERIPIVNAYVELLWAALQKMWPDLRRPERQRRVFVSHDVDWPLVTYHIPPKSLLRASVGDVFVRRDLATAIRRLTAGTAPRALQEQLDPGNTFDFIMRESERRNLRSAFYFIVENTSGMVDGTYSMDQPFVKALLREIHQRGHEVGLHPGYGTYLDEARIASSASRLLDVCEREGVQQEALGGRQHYLRWKAPETWRFWESAGLDYDSTVGFAEITGFRAGTCYEYPVFDVVERSRLGLRERPLIMMEMTLFEAASRSYMAKSDAEGLEVLQELWDTVRRLNGDMTFLWHNSSLITGRQRRLYRQALDIISA